MGVPYSTRLDKNGTRVPSEPAAEMARAILVLKKPLERLIYASDEIELQYQVL